MKRLNPDNDGTVDLDEAKAAVVRVFDKIDRDKDGTLTLKELSGRMTVKQMRTADADSDGTLDKAEFVADVERRFKVADADSDGTLDRKELRSAAGRALVKLFN